MPWRGLAVAGNEGKTGGMGRFAGAFAGCGNLHEYLPFAAGVRDSRRTAEASRGESVQPICCLRCRREIETGDKSVAVYMFAQTVGVKPRQKSTAQRICFCP